VLQVEVGGLTEKAQDGCWSCQGAIGANDRFCAQCGAAVRAPVQDTAKGIDEVSTGPMSEPVEAVMSEFVHETHSNDAPTGATKNPDGLNSANAPVRPNTLYQLTREQLIEWLKSNPVTAVFGGLVVVCLVFWLVSSAPSKLVQTQNQIKQNEEPLVSVSKSDPSNYNTYGNIQITARAPLTVQQVILNRGNCAFNDERVVMVPEPHHERGPKTLQFGEVYKAVFNCVVIEAEVHTDKGSWTFSWGR